MAPLLTQVKEVLDVIQSLATIIALVVAGIWSYWLFQVKRHQYPRLELTHHITQRPLTQHKLLCNIRTTVLNNSEVIVVIKAAEIWIQQILPLPHPDLEALIDDGTDIIELLGQYVTDEYPWTSADIPWPLVSESSLDFSKETLIQIEPQEKHEIHFDFILDRSLETVKVFTFVYQDGALKRSRQMSRFRFASHIPLLSKFQRYTRVTPPKGWSTSSICDIEYSCKRNV